MATGRKGGINEQHLLRITDIAQEPLEVLLPIDGFEEMPLVSLEDAVEKLVHLLPRVQTYAHVAKERCKKPADGLTQDESASIMLYTMGWNPHDKCLYFVLNDTLRSKDREQLTPWLLYLRLLFNALFRLPPVARTVFRGVKLNLIEQYVKGTTTIWWGFSSCSMAMSALQSELFLGKKDIRTMFTIECLNGKNIRQHSYYSSEDEILLLPATHFKIIDSLDQGDLKLIHLQEIVPRFPLLQPLPPSLLPSKQQINVEKETPISTPLEKLSLKIDSDRSVQREINILLFGITGAGRSTFINAFANYLLNDTLEQAVNDKIQVLIPFSFSFTDLDTFDERKIVYGKEDEYEQIMVPSETCTRKCRSFIFRIGDRLLRLIDTPPVGDTRGPEQDIRNFDEIMTYIAQYNYLNGILIFLLPNEQRLSVLFRYLCPELLRYLPKSAMANIMVVFTNSQSVFFTPGSAKVDIQRLFDKYQRDYSVQVPFTRENTFLVDNKAFCYLALCHNDIRLDREQTQDHIKSWNHTVKEYVRLIAYVTARPTHNVHDTVSLNEVQRLIIILTSMISKSSSLSQINKRKNDTLDEQTKIENVYRKLCKFLQINSILLFNEDSIEYFRHFICVEQRRHDSGAQNDDTIKSLEMLCSKYANEINLLRKTLKNEDSSVNKTDLIEAKDIFPLVATLYDLPINGHEIRKQVEEFKINQNKIEKREIFVQLPRKADSSNLMLQLKDCMSKS